MMRSIVRGFARFVMLVLLLPPAGGALAQREAAEAAYERLLAAPAAEVGAGLPEVPFGDWLDEVVPKWSARIVALTPCEPEADAAQGCLAIDFEIISRHRRLRLVFAREAPVFRSGVMSADELEGVFALTSLNDLPGLLRRGMRPYPLTCPPGALLRMRESYAGLFEWCEDAGGVRQGPSREWFNTGRYLLSRGQYVDGEKRGEWIECDRFERCAFNVYENGLRRGE